MIAPSAILKKEGSSSLINWSLGFEYCRNMWGNWSWHLTIGSERCRTKVSNLGPNGNWKDITEGWTPQTTEFYRTYHILEEAIRQLQEGRQLYLEPDIEQYRRYPRGH